MGDKKAKRMTGFALRSAECNPSCNRTNFKERKSANNHRYYEKRKKNVTAPARHAGDEAGVGGVTGVGMFPKIHTPKTSSSGPSTLSSSCSTSTVTTNSTYSIDSDSAFGSANSSNSSESSRTSDSGSGGSKRWGLRSRNFEESNLSGKTKA